MKKELEIELAEMITSYQIQINHINTINKIAIKYLYDFPNKLPVELKEAKDNDKEIVLKELEKAGNLIHKFSSWHESVYYMAQNPEEIKEGELQDPLSFSLIRLEKMKEDYENFFGKTNDDFFDFEYSINSQTLLMFNAILEGLLKQIIQLIIKLDVSIKKKKIKSTLNKRLEFLQNECGITEMDNPHFMNILRMLEQLRHIIVHNNGIADHTFVDNTGIMKQKIGERVKLHKDLLNIVGVVISTFVIDLFQKIHDKYFKKNRS